MKHTWVMLQYTPLEITKAYDGTLLVEATEAASELSIEQSLMGCWFCHTALTAENVDDVCPIEGHFEGNLDMPPID